MRRPGFEPGQWAWKAQVIPLDHRRFLFLLLIIFNYKYFFLFAEVAERTKA